MIIQVQAIQEPSYGVLNIIKQELFVLFRKKCITIFFCFSKKYLHGNMKSEFYFLYFIWDNIRLNPNQTNRRNILLKYLLLVLITSALLNIPKFLETTSSWGKLAVFNISCDGERMEVVETRVKLSVTWLRMNLTYIHVSSMLRLG